MITRITRSSSMRGGWSSLGPFLGASHRMGGHPENFSRQGDFKRNQRIKSVNKTKA